MRKRPLRFVGLSDHHLPWLEWHGHSAWSVLGAIAETTERAGIATGLTCPIIRYHPAVVVQVAATIGVMSEVRFTSAFGGGERLNEHVVGYGWPPVHHRHDMLREAAEIMRGLWRGNCILTAANITKSRVRAFTIHPGNGADRDRHQ